MEIRQSLKEHPGISKALMLVIIGAATIAIVFETRNQGGVEAPPKKVYFTADDGATYFADDINLAPPFTRDGKVVLRAFVFKGASGSPWVQYVGRYTPDAKANIEKVAQQKYDSQTLGNALNSGLEVKAPLTGDKGWVKFGSPQAISICEVHRPPGVLEPYEPASP